MSLLNREGSSRDAIGAILHLTKTLTGFEAVAIRLKEGDEYPYFISGGSPKDYRVAERFLCPHEESGEAGKGRAPDLYCVCADVIQGSFDPDLPFFSNGGSFWTNNASKLLKSGETRPQQTRKKSGCRLEGYESVALAPIRRDSEIIGFLQLIDSRKDLLSDEIIKFMEGIATAVGVVLSRLMREESLAQARDEMEREAEKKTIDLINTNERLLAQVIARRNARQALLESETRYKALVEAAKDLVWTTDLNFRFTFVSPSIKETLGYSVSEAMEMNPLSLLSESSRESVLKSLEELQIQMNLGRRESSSITTDVRHLHKDGSFRDMEVTLTFLTDEHGHSKGVLAICREIEKKRELEQMKTNFITVASHQLRAPLTSIRGYSELLLVRDDLSRDEQRTCLSRINEQAVLLAGQINDLLDISLLESKAPLRQDVKVVDLSRLIRETVDRFKEQHPKYRFRATLPRKSPQLALDDRRVRDVLERLMSNAVKYSPENSEISVGCELKDRAVRISVRDNGIGMGPEELERLFDKFFRADFSNTSPEGMGISMALVKSLVEAMGGTIEARSQKGSGTTVTFTIPAELQDGGQGG